MVGAVWHVQQKEQKSFHSRICACIHGLAPLQCSNSLPVVDKWIRNCDLEMMVFVEERKREKTGENPYLTIFIPVHGLHPKHPSKFLELLTTAGLPVQTGPVTGGRYPTPPDKHLKVPYWNKYTHRLPYQKRLHNSKMLRFVEQTLWRMFCCGRVDCIGGRLSSL